MSAHADQAIGMMDGAYFTSRNDILNFLNSLLNLNLQKIEETASGAVACQICEYIFPNSVPMSRVNWSARSSFEYVDNYKLLQKAFTKHKIQRYVDVDKLIRGKYQDNLEFCQWLKAFFDQTAPMMRGGREGYDPVAVRAKGKGGKAVATGKGGAKKVAPGASSRSGAPARTMGGRTGTTGTSSRSVRSTATTSSSRPNSGSSTSSSRVSAAKENNANSRLPSQSRKIGAAASSGVSKEKVAKYEEEIKTLKSENKSLKTKYTELEQTSGEIEVNLQTVESERDFYFEKLRGIEVMLQVYKEKEDEERGSGGVNKVMDSIFKVMYATMEDEVLVDDEGNIIGDVPADSSIDRSALSLKAQDEILGDDEDGEDEELLTSGLDDGAVDEADNNAPLEENDPEQFEESIPVQFSSDSDDLDDDELLTSGLHDDDEPVYKANANELINCANIINDDDDDLSDEELLCY